MTPLARFAAMSLVVLGVGCGGKVTAGSSPHQGSSADAGASSDGGVSSDEDVAEGGGGRGQQESGGANEGHAGSTAIEVEPLAVCEELSPCGGDLVGDWTFVSHCNTESLREELNQMADNGSCPELYDSLVCDYAGAVSFGKNGIVDYELTGTLDGVRRYTEGCVGSDEALTKAACQRLERDTVAASRGSDVACALDGGDCVCLVKSEAQPATYPYVVDAALVSIGDFSPIPYCVSGDVLRLGSSSNDSYGLFVRAAR
jgi:hypothetical protein